MNRLWLMLLALLLLACPTGRDDDDAVDDDDAADDDDSASGDDDDTAGDDDTVEDPPQLLASYAFVLVMFRNDPHNVFEAVEGVMNVSVSTTRFIAELQTDAGQQWEWQGVLENNETAFNVFGLFRPPGATEDTYARVRGNFLGDANQNPSQVCLTGLGEDSDPNYPDQGIEFAWYGCQIGAGEPADSPAGAHAVTLDIAGDQCGEWLGQTGWTENWSETTASSSSNATGPPVTASSPMMGRSSASPCWSRRTPVGR
jgi:hypothetical protein